MLRSEGKRRLAVVGTLAVLALLVYGGSLSGGFLNWDDPSYITANPEMRMALPQAVGHVFTTARSSNYNPIQRLVYLVEWKAFGHGPVPFRVTSLLLHVLCGYLVFRLIEEWLAAAGSEDAADGKARLAAFLAAAIFVVHPANVEDVAWISELKTLLATAFGLGAVLCYVRAAGGWRRGTATALALFVLGLLCKTSIVVVPLLLPLLDLSMRRKPSLATYGAFLAPAGVLGVVQVLAARSTGSIRALHGGTLVHHAATIAAVIPRYFEGLLWPPGRAPRDLYAPVTSLADPRFLLGCVLLAAMLAAAVLSAKRRRLWMVAWAWFLLALLPTVVVPIPILYADRYLYLAMPLVLGCAAVSLFDVLRTRTAVAVAGLSLACVVFGIFAEAYAEDWTSSVALWTRSTRLNPADATAWVSLGAAEIEAHRPGAAAVSYGRALALDPREPGARLGRARADLTLGLPKEAEGELAALVRQDPSSGDGWAELGAIKDMIGETAAAASTFRAGVKHCPDDATLWRNLGQFHFKHHRLERALSAFEKAERIAPRDARTLRVLARICRELKRPTDAERYEMEAEAVGRRAGN